MNKNLVPFTENVRYGVVLWTDAMIMRASQNIEAVYETDTDADFILEDGAILSNFLGEPGPKPWKIEMENTPEGHVLVGYDRSLVPGQETGWRQQVTRPVDPNNVIAEVGAMFSDLAA